jgi:hypothetical protein
MEEMKNITKEIDKDKIAQSAKDYNFNLEKRIDMLRDKIIETTNFIKKQIDR